MNRLGHVLVSLALVASPAICQVGRGPISGGGGGGVTGLTSCAGGTALADNSVMRSDGTTGCQGSGFILSDVAGGAITLSTIAGTSYTIAATAPTATTGASQAGKSASLTASAAVASTDTAGAAAGGSVTITGGAAARNTSGNANGGDINLVPGAGIGTGVQGQVLGPVGASGTPGYAFTGDPNTGMFQEGGDVLAFSIGGNRLVNLSTTSGLALQGTKLTGATRPLEKNTAGSGAPNVLATDESNKVLTNEGATAENYHTLPAAAGTSSVRAHMFTFIVQDADGIRITAAAGDTIRIGASASGAGGFIRCLTVGGVVTVYDINDTEWVVDENHVICTIDI